jgi:outer membrane protein assembly factor BamE
MRRFALFTLLLALLNAGCIVAYKPDVQQGNIVTPEMLEKLKIGMTRSQVRFVLGTPLLTDSFHPDRWDYFYSFKKGRDDSVENRLVTVVFDKDSLKRIDDNLLGIQ